MNIAQRQIVSSVPSNPLEELKNHLTQDDCTYPKEIIDSIISQKELTTSLMLETLAQCAVYNPRHISDEDWVENILICFMLAKLREQKAFPHLIKLCQLPHKTAEEFWGDIKTEHLPAMLASTYNGDMQSLYNIIANQHYEEYVRSSALDAVEILYLKNKISREEIMAILKRLFSELRNDYTHLPSALVDTCCTVYAKELLPEINDYFNLELVDFLYIDPVHVEKTFAHPEDEILAASNQDHFKQFVDDIERDINWIFKDKEEEHDETLYKSRKILNYDSLALNTYKRSTPKISRNAPCFCGSKKKYKKCCGDIVTF